MSSSVAAEAKFQFLMAEASTSPVPTTWPLSLSAWANMLEKSTTVETFQRAMPVSVASESQSKNILERFVAFARFQLEMPTRSVRAVQPENISEKSVALDGSMEPPSKRSMKL